MNRRIWRIYAALVLIGCLTALIDFRWMTGWLLGCAAAVLTYLLTERFCTGALKSGSSSGAWPDFLVNYLIWAAVLVLSAVLKDYFNIFTCAAGLLSVTLTMTAGALILRKGSDEEK